MNAACAAGLSPAAMAVSTFLTKVRTRLTRERLLTALRAFLLIRFLADWCCAIFIDLHLTGESAALIAVVLTVVKATPPPRH